MQDGIEEGDVQDRKWQKIKLWRLSIRLTSLVHYLLFPEWNLYMLCLHVDPMPNVSVTTHAPTNTHSHILHDNTDGNSVDDRSWSVLIFKVRSTLLCPVVQVPEGASTRVSSYSFGKPSCVPGAVLRARIKHTPSDLKERKQSFQSGIRWDVLGLWHVVRVESRKGGGGISGEHGRDGIWAGSGARRASWAEHWREWQPIRLCLI